MRSAVQATTDVVDTTERGVSIRLLFVCEQVMTGAMAIEDESEM